MNEPNPLIYPVASELNGTLNASGVPRIATIFYHENRWYYELKPGLTLDNELRQRENHFNWLRSANFLNMALGPFDFQPVDIQVELFGEGKRFLYSITSINGRRLARPMQRTRGPIAPIKLVGGAAYDAARVPEGASHYCWLNGSNITETQATDAKVNEAAMLLQGGLAYLDHDQSGSYRVIQINRFQRTDSGHLEYKGPIKWQSEYTQTLVEQDRFTHPSVMPFVEGGVCHLAFINADEEFTSLNNPNRKWVPTRNGAFLYLFNEDKSANDQDCFYELSPDVLGTLASDEH